MAEQIHEAFVKFVFNSLIVVQLQIPIYLPLHRIKSPSVALVRSTLPNFKTFNKLLLSITSLDYGMQ